MWNMNTTPLIHCILVIISHMYTKLRQGKGGVQYDSQVGKKGEKSLEFNVFSWAIASTFLNHFALFPLKHYLMMLSILKGFTGPSLLCWMLSHSYAFTNWRQKLENIGGRQDFRPWPQRCGQWTASVFLILKSENFLKFSQLKYWLTEHAPSLKYSALPGHSLLKSRVKLFVRVVNKGDHISCCTTQELLSVSFWRHICLNLKYLLLLLNLLTYYGAINQHLFLWR